MPVNKMSSHFPTFRLTVAARMADYQQRMAEQIRRERERRGWRREDLAQKTGASYRQIERWETGKSRPQIANRIALAEVFEMDLADLFPDLEAEEEALRDQLDRIESKLDELLSRLPARGPAEVLEEEVARVRGQRKRSAAASKRKPQSREAS